MGEVWKAEHINLGSPVAIKVIVDAGFDAENPLREELVARFFREAQAAAALRSPHVVQILDHGVDGVPYIAMELLEGETLEERLERTGVLPHAMTADIITHVARAISKAHEAGIVHRDLKPGNVFIVRNDDEEIAKVLDFGIAKVTPQAGFEEGGSVATRTGSVVGTPCYMSPEQALGNKTIDHRSDLWSLAVIAFECIVGQRPFDSEAFGDLIVAICARPIPVPSKLASVPEGFDAWWAKAASRDPDGRFQSAKELAEALRAVIAPETVSIRQQRITHTSIPAIVTTQGAARQSTPEALAQTQHQATHAGVVSAISAPDRNRRRRKGALVIGAASFLVTAAAMIVFLATRGKPPETEPAAAGTGAPGQSTTAPNAKEASSSAAASGASPAVSASGAPETSPSATAQASTDASSKPAGAQGPHVSPATSTAPSSTGTTAVKTSGGATTKTRPPNLPKGDPRLGF
jgi:serine/threonine-protein kinase